MGIPIWIWGAPYGNSAHRFHTGIWNKCIPISIWVFPYGNGYWHIPIWKRLITVSIWGLKSSGSLFPYGNPRMETGIDTSSFLYGDCPLPYRELKPIYPRFYMGIFMWKQVLTHPHMKMVNHHFHMGSEKFRLLISIWESPYGNGGLTYPHFHMGTIQSLTRFHMLSKTIWEYRKKSPHENKFSFGLTVFIW